MEQNTSVVEYWTATRRGLVLSGKPNEIETIASVLHLPCDAPVRVTPSLATLALWGDALETYTRAFAANGYHDHADDDGLTSESPALVSSRADD